MTTRAGFLGAIGLAAILPALWTVSARAEDPIAPGRDEVQRPDDEARRAEARAAVDALSARAEAQQEQLRKTLAELKEAEDRLRRLEQDRRVDDQAALIRAFRADPEVRELIAAIERTREQLGRVRRLARGDDETAARYRADLNKLTDRYRQLWATKAPTLAAQLGTPQVARDPEALERKLDRLIEEVQQLRRELRSARRPSKPS